METIKPFEQLTDKELLELTNEQVDYYIKLKKAENGVRILEEPEIPKYREIPETDVVLYCVAGRCFLNQEIATEIANKINEHISESYKADYDYYNGGSETKYARLDDSSIEDVRIERVYDKKTYDSIRDVVASNKKIKEQYEKIKGEYDDETAKAKELVDNIYDAISQARERLEQFNEYKIRIVEYLRLANGNVEVAWNFFDKAYLVDTQVKSKIMESEEYTTALDGYLT